MRELFNIMRCDKIGTFQSFLKIGKKTKKAKRMKKKHKQNKKNWRRSEKFKVNNRNSISGDGQKLLGNKLLILRKYLQIKPNILFIKYLL